MLHTSASLFQPYRLEKATTMEFCSSENFVLHTLVTTSTHNLYNKYGCILGGSSGVKVNLEFLYTFFPASSTWQTF